MHLSGEVLSMLNYKFACVGLNPSHVVDGQPTQLFFFPFRLADEWVLREV